MLHSLIVLYLRRFFEMLNPFLVVRFQALPDLQGGCAN
jgi:hypothetical protein